VWGRREKAATAHAHAGGNGGGGGGGGAKVLVAIVILPVTSQPKLPTPKILNPTLKDGIGLSPNHCTRDFTGSVGGQHWHMVDMGPGRSTAGGRGRAT